MLRFFGGILIFTVCSYVGFYLSGRLKRRCVFLRDMSDALSYISAEIEFGQYELENIFGRIDDTSLYGFFSICAEKAKECGIRSAWTEAVNICSENAALKDEDKSALLQLGGQIGMSDAEGQKNAIQRTIMHIDEYRNSADEEYSRLSKPYRSCGILLGVFFLIFLA